MNARTLVRLLEGLVLASCFLAAAEAARGASTPKVEALIPAGFVPSANDFADDDVKGRFMGIFQVRGRALKPRNGVPCLYVVHAPAGRLKGEPFQAGDVIVALQGAPMKHDPLSAFKMLAETVQEQNGTLTFTRWRQGVTQTITLTFDGKPDIPDLTRGGHADLTQMSWNLGTTGAKGWIWAIPHQSTEGSRQILITQIEKGSAADGVLQVGDVILGANGRDFQHDARKEFAHALTESETTEKAGQLVLKVWNSGQTRTATLTLRVMGDYSATTPFDCPKTRQIVDDAVRHLLQKGLGEGVSDDVDALGLLATGRAEVMPLVRAHARKIAALGHDLQFRQAMETWHWGYHNLFLTEYYLATKDASVLPAIREYSTKIALGQSHMGNWGHSMCVPYPMSDGPLYGVTPGYGALNQAGLPCMISLALATKCGIHNAPITLALKRGGDFFRFYVDKGAIPYGDHSPEEQAHDDNGKSSLAAVMFDLMGDPKAATFFTRMTLASYNEREPGHTGNYFSFLWGPLGAACGGDAAASAFMSRLEWFFDLERRRDGAFIYQGKPGMPNKASGENQYFNWDCTGARLLAYCLPLKKLYITGKGRPAKNLPSQDLAQALDAGALTPKQYQDLPTRELLAKLGDWSPAVRDRAARALATKPDNVVPQLIAMLDSPNRYARYGACEGLRFAGRGSIPAADAIIAQGLHSSDETMVFFALRAFSSYDQAMGLSTLASRALPVMLKMAAPDYPGHLSARMQNELAYYLFYSGNATRIKSVARQGRGVSQVDSEVLVTAVRELLKVEFGASRSCVAAVYDKLTDKELQQLWKDIYRATRQLAPGDIMFADGVQLAGLQLMAKHHTQEGLDTAVWYLTNQKPHGAPARTQTVLKLIVEQYGGYARAKIPELEQAADYLASHYHQAAAAHDVRQAILAIQKAPTPTWPMTSIAPYLK